MRPSIVTVIYLPTTSNIHSPAASKQGAISYVYDLIASCCTCTMWGNWTIPLSLQRGMDGYIILIQENWDLTHMGSPASSSITFPFIIVAIECFEAHCE